MDYRQVLHCYHPQTKAEEKLKNYMQAQVALYGDLWLERDCPHGHLTVGALVVNSDYTQVLFMHHKLRNTWSWTGGHMDGMQDPLQVAIKEAQEETGLTDLQVLTPLPLAIDCFQVPTHERRGVTVEAHIHSVFAYVFVADPQASLIINTMESNDVAWLSVEDIHLGNFSQEDIYLYKNLLQRLRKLKPVEDSAL